MKTSLVTATLAALSAISSAHAQSAPHEVKAREIYARIIEFRTSEGHKQTAAMAEYLIGVLKAGGVPASDIATLNEGEATAMIVRLPGADRGRPILFSAHMDVVDARPEEWERNPYKLIEQDGFFYGRGTADNKAGVAALMSTILRFKAENLKPGRELVFAFVGDEETSMATTKAIAAHEWVRNAEFAINTDAGGGILDSQSGEPRIYVVQGAEKTYATFELTVTNEGGHSSRPRSDNAIYQLARALLQVEAHAFPVMANDLTRSYLRAVGNTLPGELGRALRTFAGDPSDVEAAAVIAKSPDFVGTTRTTCVATMLDAGHAENALPQTAKGTVNCRIFPGVAVEAVRDELAIAIADSDVKITTLDTPQASPVSEMRPDVMAAIELAVHGNYPGVPVEPYISSGATDGKHYRIAGIPTFGTSGMFTKPGESFAHGLNERLRTDSFYKGLDHTYRLAVALGGAKKTRTR